MEPLRPCDARLVALMAQALIKSDAEPVVSMWPDPRDPGEIYVMLQHDGRSAILRRPRPNGSEQERNRAWRLIAATVTAKWVRE